MPPRRISSLEPVCPHAASVQNGLRAGRLHLLSSDIRDIRLLRGFLSASTPRKKHAAAWVAATTFYAALTLQRFNVAEPRKALSLWRDVHSLAVKRWGGQYDSGKC